MKRRRRYHRTKAAKKAHDAWERYGDWLMVKAGRLNEEMNEVVDLACSATEIAVDILCGIQPVRMPPKRKDWK